MRQLTVALAAFAAAGMELAEAALVVLVVMGRGHRREALVGAAAAAIVVVAAAVALGPQVLDLVPIQRLRQLLGAGLLLLGGFWLVQAIVRPQAAARELAHETATARRRSQRGGLAAAFVSAKAVGVEGAEAAVLVVGVGAPQRALPSAAAGAAVAVVVIVILALRLEGRLNALAARTLSRVAGTALVFVGCYWLTEASRLRSAYTVAAFLGVAALAGAAWLRPSRPAALTEPDSAAR